MKPKFPLNYYLVGLIALPFVRVVVFSVQIVVFRRYPFKAAILVGMKTRKIEKVTPSPVDWADTPLKSLEIQKGTDAFENKTT